MTCKNFLIIILLAVFIFSCGQTADDQTDIKPISLRTDPGKTVFDLLLAEHEVDYIESGMGVFIKSIDGIKNAGGHFWIYYVNDKRGDIACSKFIVSEGDKIEWRYE
jgi:hypothetical protein